MDTVPELLPVAPSKNPEFVDPKLIMENLSTTVYRKLKGGKIAVSIIQPLWHAYALKWQFQIDFINARTPLALLIESLV
jgi:hypothetical protein